MPLTHPALGCQHQMRPCLHCPQPPQTPLPLIPPALVCHQLSQRRLRRRQRQIHMPSIPPPLASLRRSSKRNHRQSPPFQPILMLSTLPILAFLRRRTSRNHRQSPRPRRQLIRSPSIPPASAFLRRSPNNHHQRQQRQTLTPLTLAISVSPQSQNQLEPRQLQQTHTLSTPPALGLQGRPLLSHTQACQQPSPVRVGGKPHPPQW